MYTHPKSEFDDELVYSTSSQAREFHYTHCLGFSKSSTSPHTNRGPQKFLGKVGDFHNAIKLVVDQIAIKYESRIDLEETIANSPPSFKDEDIEACLKVWGPFIWTNGRNGTPFVTSIDTEDGNYPAHLKYENKNDRNRVRMLVYCWIIHRAHKRLEGKTAPTTTDADVPAQAGRKHGASERPRSLPHLCFKFVTVVFAIPGFAISVLAMFDYAKSLFD